MTAHLYWRINVSALSPEGGNLVTIAELGLHTSIGGGQAATGGTASASSSYSSSWLPANAFDGNASTAWAAAVGQFPAWLQYQFPSAVAIVEYSITGRNDVSGYDPGSWTLQYSDDGSTWTVADTRTNQSGWTIGQARTFAVPGAPTTRKRRIVAIFE